MFNRPLSSFVPSIYKDIVEMDSLIRSEEQLMGIARREMTTVFANTFVVTADETGIKMFEDMLGILSSPSESLEFRRQRVLNRLSMSPPFTFRFLKQRLDEIIGVGAWSAYIDFDTYTLYVESSAVDQHWYTEMEFTINRIKPCNIVFTNAPYSSTGLKISEGISYTTMKWWNKLGSWRLGSHPFATLEGGGDVKMPEIRSVQNALLGDAASFIADDIASVLINDEIEISSFEAKQSSDNFVSIQYRVLPSQTSLVTDIKLRNSSGAVLTHSSVYVPVTQDILCKHNITVKEGV